MASLAQVGQGPSQMNTLTPAQLAALYGQPAAVPYGTGMTPGSAWNSSGMPAVTGVTGPNPNEPTLNIGGGPEANQGVINELGLTPPQNAPTGPSLANLEAGMAYGAAHQPPAPVDYSAAYRAALAASTASIDQQFRIASGSINTQQQQGQQALAPMPGQLAAIANQAAASGNANNAAALAADKAAGVTGKGFGGTAGNMAEINAAGAQNRATEASTVPQMGLALAAQMNNERSQLNAAHLSAIDALNQHAMDIAASQGAQAQAHHWSQQDAETNYQHQLSLALLSSKSTVNQPDLIIPSMTTGEIQSIRGTPAYKNAVTLLTSGNGSGTPTSPADIQKMYASNPKLLMVLARDYRTLFK